MVILIVDDSPIMRKIILRCLRQAELPISTALEAANGEEALTHLRATPPPAIVFADINMPALDGLGLLESVRAENLAPATPIVIISAEGAQPKVLRAVAAGARAYLCKPFTAQQVRERILPLLPTPGAP